MEAEYASRQSEAVERTRARGVSSFFGKEKMSTTEAVDKARAALDTRDAQNKADLDAALEPSAPKRLKVGDNPIDIADMVCSQCIRINTRMVNVTPQHSHL